MLTCLSPGQSTAKATEFYNDKIKGLESNLKDLAKVVQSKDLQLKAIEDGKSRVHRHIPGCQMPCPNGLFSPETKGPQWRSWGCRRRMKWHYNVRYRSMYGCAYVQNKKKKTMSHSIGILISYILAAASTGLIENTAIIALACQTAGDSEKEEREQAVQKQKEKRT